MWASVREENVFMPDADEIRSPFCEALLGNAASRMMR
jgi:hypothetical protein